MKLQEIEKLGLQDTGERIGGMRMFKKDSQVVIFDVLSNDEYEVHRIYKNVLEEIKKDIDNNIRG